MIFGTSQPMFFNFNKWGYENLVLEKIQIQLLGDFGVDIQLELKFHLSNLISKNLH